jgi:hypothetical protein
MKKEKTMLSTKKFVLPAAIVVSVALGVTATTAAFANAPGGAYIQCGGGHSSPVYTR